MLAPNTPVAKPELSRSVRHQARAHAVIPGGAHTYAKGDDQFPEGLCPVVVRGAGCRVWDLDGNDYVEYGAGVRSVTLGHGYRPVCDAAYRATLDGTNFVRPAALELAAAEKMLGVVPGADMVKFGKNGSDAVTGALKLARAYTGRTKVAVCGDHPFFSVDDWFIATTAMDSGIPPWNADQTLKFRYNDLAGLAALFERHPNEIACVIMEAETTEPPAPNYLHHAQTLCHKHGALFVLDETITGFRWHIGGAQARYDFLPDLSTFGKAMANGFSVAALCGKREIMRLAGIEYLDRERCFVLSLTHGAETGGLAACMATIDAYREHDVIGTLERQGAKLRVGLEQAATAAGVGDFFKVSGRPQLLLYATLDAQKQRSQEFRTLFLQELIRGGVLAPNFVVNAAHTDADVQQTVDAAAGALRVYAAGLSDGVERFLDGRAVKPVFRKFN